MMKKFIKFIAYTGGSVLTLAVGGLISGMILQLSGVDIASLTKEEIVKYPIFIILPSFMWVIFILLIYKNYKAVYEGFIKFCKAPLKNLGVIGVALVAMCIITFGIGLFGAGDSANQKIAAEISSISLIVVAVLLAPFTEELIFRKYLIGDSKNKKIMVVVSSFLFMLVHVISEVAHWDIDILQFLLISVPYLLMGGVFGYVYYRYQNIALNIMLHSSWNLFAVILMLTTS